MATHKAEPDDGPGRGPAVGLARQAVASVGKDLQRAVLYTVVNSLAGSVWMPRVVRYLVYRMVGMDVRTPNIAYHTRFFSREVSIGAKTFVNTEVIFEGGPIRIGARTMVGHQVAFLTADHPRDEQGRPTMAYRALPIEVGSDCWLGARVTVLGGVRIADGCIVAAGSTVTRDLEEPGVYAGAPARLVKAVPAPAVALT